MQRDGYPIVVMIPAEKTDVRHRLVRCLLPIERHGVTEWNERHFSERSVLAGIEQIHRAGHTAVPGAGVDGIEGEYSQSAWEMPGLAIQHELLEFRVRAAKIGRVDAEEHAGDLFDHPQGEDVKVVPKGWLPLSGLQDEHPLVDPFDVFTPVPSPGVVVTTNAKRVCSSAALINLPFGLQSTTFQQFVNGVGQEASIVEGCLRRHVLVRELSHCTAKVASPLYFAVSHPK